MIENLKKLNILYVEDDDFIRNQTSQLLKLVFNGVYTASDGCEGLIEYSQHKNEVDAIITDINMPELSGIDMAKKLKKNYENKSPIIALSAYDCSDYGMKEISSNFAHYLKKPVQIKDLLISVDKATKGIVGDYCK